MSKSNMKKRDLFFAILVILVCWQILTWLIDKPILPGPIIVLETFLSEFTNGLLGHLLASLWRVTASTALAILLAAPAGLAMGQSARINAVFSPIVYLIYPIPKFSHQLCI